MWSYKVLCDCAPVLPSSLLRIYLHLSFVRDQSVCKIFFRESGLDKSSYWSLRKIRIRFSSSIPLLPVLLGDKLFLSLYKKSQKLLFSKFLALPLIGSSSSAFLQMMKIDLRLSLGLNWWIFLDIQDVLSGFFCTIL